MIGNKKIVCVDVESNGLHGDSFAVGAVVLSMQGELLQAFLCKSPLTGHPAQFVVDKVLPALKDVKFTHTKARDMRVDFMRWLSWIATQYEIEMFADWTYPVDGRFLIAAGDETPGMKPPFMIVHDVSTLLLALGMDPDLDRYEFVKDEMHGELQKHNPVWDAEVSARTTRKLLSMLEERVPKTNTSAVTVSSRGIETGRTQALEPNIANTPKEISYPIEALPVYDGSNASSNGVDVE